MLHPLNNTCAVPVHGKMRKRHVLCGICRFLFPNPRKHMLLMFLEMNPVKDSFSSILLSGITRPTKAESRNRKNNLDPNIK